MARLSSQSLSSLFPFLLSALRQERARLIRAQRRASISWVSSSFIHRRWLSAVDKAILSLSLSLCLSQSLSVPPLSAKHLFFSEDYSGGSRRMSCSQSYRVLTGCAWQEKKQSKRVNNRKNLSNRQGVRSALSLDVDSELLGTFHPPAGARPAAGPQQQ